MTSQVSGLELLEKEASEKADFIVTFNLYRGIMDYALLMRSKQKNPFRKIEKSIDELVKRGLNSVKYGELEDNEEE